MSIAYKAMLYATQQHTSQQRKFSNEPYIIHLAEVAGIVASVAWTHPAMHPQTLVAVAWLHDILEDTNSHVSVLHQLFGQEVAYGVQCLTCDPHEDKNTAESEYTKKLSNCPSWVQTIKCADMISNLRNIWTRDTKFATGYTKRCRERIQVLTNADHRLKEIVNTLLIEPKKKHEKSKV